MSEEQHWLETELRSLRPVAPSPQLRGRIDQRLRQLEERRFAGRVGGWRIFASAALAAACLVVAAIVGNHGVVVGVPRAAPQVPVEQDVRQYTLAAYGDAAAISVESLNAMLDRQSMSEASHPVQNMAAQDVGDSLSESR
jgi:hypothetical protein